jgi:hypothetical protein
MYRLIAVAAVVATGCGSRCKDVESARTALRTRVAAANRGADVQVRVPLERANTLIAELLRAEPVSMAIDAPDIGPIEISVKGLTATATEVKLRPGPPGKIRFATRVEIRDQEPESPPVTTLVAVAEVTPVLERKDDGAALVIGLGSENLLSIKPELGPDQTRQLGDAVTRWMPAGLRDRVPRMLRDAAVRKLSSHLTGAAYTALQRTLLKRVGEVTRLRLRLPDVPVASTSITSTEQLLEVEIATDLQVRRGLAPGGGAAGDDVSVRISASAAAELANWAIEHGHAPRWYDRSLDPRPEGEFRPYFDYVAEEKAHPIKVYAFQERGGCSYFRVGVQADVGLDGDKLRATARDRVLEKKSANPVIELAAWTKYFLFGWVDQSKRIAAHTRMTAGNRTLDTQVVGAALANDELTFKLRFTAAPLQASH